MESGKKICKILKSYADDPLKSFPLLFTFLKIIQPSESNAAMTQIRTIYQKRSHQIKLIFFDSIFDLLQKCQMMLTKLFKLELFQNFFPL